MVHPRSVSLASGPPIAPNLHQTVLRAPPEPHRNLAVAPLIGDQRCYGEVPVRLRWGPQDGLVQVGRNGGARGQAHTSRMNHRWILPRPTVRAGPPNSAGYRFSPASAARRRYSNE